MPQKREVRVPARCKKTLAEKEAFCDACIARARERLKIKKKKNPHNDLYLKVFIIFMNLIYLMLFVVQAGGVNGEVMLKVQPRSGS